VLVRDRANYLMLDPRTGDTLALQNAADMPWPARWVDTSDPLHFGNFAGIGIKLLWFVLGLMLSSLCLTGAYLHIKRLNSHGISDRYRWRGTMLAITMTAVLLLIASWGGWKEILNYGPIANGVPSLPEVPLPTTLFLALWTLLTLGIMGLWSWCVLRPSGHSGARVTARSSFTETGTSFSAPR
jgi:uncharacterized iron-regulated membrane protein